MNSINNLNLFGIEITKFHIEINLIKGKEENINPCKLSINANNTNITNNNNNKKDKVKNQSKTINGILKVEQNNNNNNSKFRNKNVTHSELRVQDLKLFNNDFIDENNTDNLNNQQVFKKFSCKETNLGKININNYYSNNNSNPKNDSLKYKSQGNAMINKMNLINSNNYNSNMNHSNQYNSINNQETRKESVYSKHSKNSNTATSLENNLDSNYQSIKETESIENEYEYSCLKVNDDDILEKNFKLAKNNSNNMTNMTNEAINYYSTNHNSYYSINNNSNNIRSSHKMSSQNQFLSNIYQSTSKSYPNKNSDISKFNNIGIQEKHDIENTKQNINNNFNQNNMFRNKSSNQIREEINAEYKKKDIVKIDLNENNNSNKSNDNNKFSSVFKVAENMYNNSCNFYTFANNVDIGKSIDKEYIVRLFFINIF